MFLYLYLTTILIIFYCGSDEFIYDILSSKLL